MSQPQLANVIGVSSHTIANIETRKHAVSLATAAAVAIYLGLPSDTLLRP